MPQTHVEGVKAYQLVGQPRHATVPRLPFAKPRLRFIFYKFDSIKKHRFESKTPAGFHKVRKYYCLCLAQKRNADPNANPRFSGIQICSRSNTQNSRLQRFPYRRVGFVCCLCLFLFLKGGLCCDCNTYPLMYGNCSRWILISAAFDASDAGCVRCELATD